MIFASVLGGKCLTAITGDFNEYTVGSIMPTFCYSLSSWSNKPSVNAGLLFVFSENITQNKKVFQLFMETATGKLYTRQRTSNTGSVVWNEWVSLD